MSQEPLTNENGEVRELTADDMKLFKPTYEVLPPEILAVLPVLDRGTHKARQKISATVWFDADILEYFRATGQNWQTRINEALREHVVAHQ